MIRPNGGSMRSPAISIPRSLGSFDHGKATTNWIVSADFARARCHEELAEPAQARSVYDKIIRTAGASSEFGRLAQQRIDAL